MYEIDVPLSMYGQMTELFPRKKRKCPRIHGLDYFESGRTLQLTKRRNGCSGIFKNKDMFRNKVNQTHPQFFLVSKHKDDGFLSKGNTDRRTDLILNLMVN